MQERYWEDHIRTGYTCQTVRTVCRLPRVWRFSEARNIQRHSFEEYLSRMSVEEKQAMQIVVAAGSWVSRWANAKRATSPRLPDSLNRRYYPSNSVNGVVVTSGLL